MKATNIMFFLMLSSGMISSYSQSEVKTVVHNGAGFQEQYDIKIEKGDTVKHGPYKKYVDGKLHVLGTYLEGSKNHMWTYYHSSGQKQAEGLLASNEEVGLWSYFDASGKCVQKYHHTLDSLYFFVVTNELEEHYVLMDEADTVVMKLDSPPLFLGGNQQAVLLANKEITYPTIAKEKELEGMVYITFWVTTDGQAIDHKIHKDLGDGCGQEALKAIQNLPQSWIPGKLNGKNVKAKVYFPVHFKLR